MPARQHTPLSGSPLPSDLPRDESWSDAHHRDFESGPVELKPKVAPRSGSFAAPLRDSFRESFFDLAQRYQTLRDAARRATGSSKKPVPELGANRERRLTDLPPPPPPAPRERMVTEEPPEEPTLVQPLAQRAPEAVPAESERRPTTMRPPPPPDPLPRMILPSSMPPALALPTSPPPPPAPPQSVWRPMLAAAALSATIGALVSGGFVALRSFSTPRPTAAATTTDQPTTTSAAATSTGPCPVGVATSGTEAAPASTSHTTSWASITSSGTTAVAASQSPAIGSTSHSSPAPAPLQVSVENLPLLQTSGSSKLTESRATTPMRAPIHVAQPVRSVAAAPQTAAERRRAKKEAAAAAAAAQQTAAKSNDDDDDDSDAPKAEPPPPPAPTKGPDKAVIAKAVARAASAATSCDSGPRNGRALITFAPSGNVQSVSLVESFGDQAVNGCVLRALGRAHVPPFAGGPVEVRKGLSW